MIDCYRILGVSPRASQEEIRAAYIGRMKVLHPDARGAPGADAGTASDISAAYAQLRTRERRSEHDRQLFASTALAGVSATSPPPIRRIIPGATRRPLRSQRREQASRVLTGAAVGIVVLALAAPAGLFWLAHLNPIEPARASATPPAALTSSASDLRRPIDGAMRAAAADDFATVVRDFGLSGARTFSRQCLAELPARASMAMLDYCIAFDDAAANWEQPRGANAGGERFFGDHQRSAQYRLAAQSVLEPEVRSAMLQEAGFFERGPSTATFSDAPAEFSAL